MSINYICLANLWKKFEVIYRRKFLLAFLERIGQPIDTNLILNYIFLLCQKQILPSYNFIEYNNRVINYTINNDLEQLTKNKFLLIQNKKIKLLKNGFIKEIRKTDLEIISNLIKTKTQSLGSNKFNERYNKGHIIFTIGYEGLNIEQYISILLKNNIEILFDIRKNPVSRKYGFSKKILTNICDDLQIEYYHLPEWGIDSEYRKKLKNDWDLNKLFSYYRSHVLSDLKNHKSYFSNKIKLHKNVAFTCFEKNSQNCHRSLFAEQLSKYLNLMVEHL